MSSFVLLHQREHVTGKATQVVMGWTHSLIALLHADFGGLATFFCDPDHLIDIPLVREAVRGDGFQIEEWDGNEAGLTAWMKVPNDQKPCIVVHEASGKWLVERHISSHRWQPVAISDVFPAFAPEIIRELPVELWDQIYEIGKEHLHRLSAKETLDVLGRALYGLDPQHLRFGEGWWRAWIEVAADEQGWPGVIAGWAAKAAPSPYIDTERLIQTLTQPNIARSHLLAMQREQWRLLETLSPVVKANLERFVPVEPTKTEALFSAAGFKAGTPHQEALWENFDVATELNPKRSSRDVLEFACRFARCFSSNSMSEAIRIQADGHFVTWLQLNYELAMTATGPRSLSLPKLVNQLDEECGDTPLLLAVVDSLGLRAWQVVKRVWLADGIFQTYEERSAFAVLPTITSFSRRAIFEGKLPAQFGAERHTQALERKMWKNRFGECADYFAPVEHLGISDAFATKRQRIAVVDVQWDKKGHAIDPRFDTIEEEAEKWAERSDMRRVIQQALLQGYRVILTSDHGHVACKGIGRPNTGETVSERSKRCMVFKSAPLREQYAPPSTIAWTPVGLDHNMHPLFTSGFDSFDYVGSRGVSHGGLSLEEAIVPVIDLKI